MQKLTRVLNFGTFKLAYFLGFASILNGLGAYHSSYAFDEMSDSTAVGEFRKGPLLLGSMVATYAFQGSTQQQYSDTIKRNFTVIVPEYEMKFDSIHRDGRYSYNFGDADKIMDFAVANKMKVRGHTLVWRYVPAWVTQGNFSSTELEKIMVEHITTVMNHFKTKYPGVIIGWDVVNEAYNLERNNARPIWAKIGQFDANGNPNPKWDPVKDYVRVAFRAAKAADPSVKLYYNDFENESLGGRSDEIFRFVSELKNEGVPIEGIGFEAHVGLYAQNRLTQFEANMKRYSDLGLELSVTELDVGIPVKDPSTGYIPSDPNDLNRQASIYGDLATACARNASCVSILTWGFTYRYSWIPSFFPGLGAATPFDQNYNPTPSWTKMKSIVDAANNTPPPPPPAITCSVSVDTGTPWKVDTGYANWLNFYVKVTGTQGVNVPWTFRVYNPNFISVSYFWNWRVRAVEEGRIRGVVNQGWQNLYPNGSNSVPLGMVVTSTVNSFQPVRIALNGVLCTVVNN